MACEYEFIFHIYIYVWDQDGDLINVDAGLLANTTATNIKRPVKCNSNNTTFP